MKMIAVKTVVGKDPVPVTPDSPASKRIFLNTNSCDALCMQRVADALTAAGYEVVTNNSLQPSSLPKIKHAPLINSEAMKVAKILGKIGIVLPVEMDRLLSHFEFGIVVWLVDGVRAARMGIADLRTEVESLEELARQYNIACRQAPHFGLECATAGAEFEKQREKAEAAALNIGVAIIALPNPGNSKTSTVGKLEQEHGLLLNRLYTTNHATALSNIRLHRKSEVTGAK